MMGAVAENEQQAGPPALRAPSEPLPAPRAAPVSEPIDPEQVRQYQQFQQFQELMRQQGPPVGLLPPPRKPLWKKILGSWLVRRLVLLLIIVLGLYFAYQHYFGSNDENLPASKTGGHTFTDRELLLKAPDQTVRMLYQRVGEGETEVSCGQFTKEAADQFARNFNATSCQDAVTALSKQLTGRKNDYAEPGFPQEMRNLPSSVSVLEISSCRLQVVGGPRLGWFRVEKTPYDGQWIITEHQTETCR